MSDPQLIAASLSDDERRALLALTAEGEYATISLQAVRCLHERGLAVVLPDGHINLSSVVWSVVEVLKSAEPVLQCC